MTSTANGDDGIAFGDSGSPARVIELSLDRTSLRLSQPFALSSLNVHIRPVRFDRSTGGVRHALRPVPPRKGST